MTIAAPRLSAFLFLRARRFGSGAFGAGACAAPTRFVARTGFQE